MKRWIVCGVLLLLLFLSLVPVGLPVMTGNASAEAQTQFPYMAIENGTAVEVIAYSGPGGAAVIPAELGGLPVTEIADSAFSVSNITSITIPENVAHIGNDAFFDCTSLSTITFEGNAPSVASSWLAGCNSNITIYYQSGASGFSSPYWHGVRATSGSSSSQDLSIIYVIVAILVGAIIVVSYLSIRKKAAKPLFVPKYDEAFKHLLQEEKAQDGQLNQYHYSSK